MRLGNVGIGTTAPASALDVSGQIKIQGGTPGLGKVLTSDANGLASWSTPAASFSAMTFLTTTGAGTWTVPSGITKVKVTMLGAGAGGASTTCTTGSSAMGVPGAAGGFCMSYLAVTPGAAISYTVGAGGSAGAAGGNTTVSTLGANGGAAGSLLATAGGSTSGCQVGITGAVGQAGGQLNYIVSPSAYGGWGFGGQSAVANSGVGQNGNAAKGYGAGGGGAACTLVNGTYSGGAGANGMILIEY